MSETKAVSKGLADQFDAEFAALGGTTSVRKTVPDGATAEQFSEFLTIAAQARPDFVFFGGEYNVAAVLPPLRSSEASSCRSWAATG